MDCTHECHTANGFTDFNDYIASKKELAKLTPDDGNVRYMTKKQFERYLDLDKRVKACDACLDICIEQESLLGGHINLRRKSKNRRTIKKNRKYRKKTRGFRV